MLTFGFFSLTDALSAIIVVSLGAKAIGTMILLIAGRDVRDRPGWGAALWWTTKITPIIAVPCAIALALIEKQIDSALVFLGMAVFVAIAVPLKIRQRRARLRQHVPV